MKWKKLKIAENCYCFNASDKKTKFDFSICYNAGDVELTCWYHLCDEPFYEFNTKTPYDYKTFVARELEPYKRSLIRGVYGKLSANAEYFKEILYNLEK